MCVCLTYQQASNAVLLLSHTLSPLLWPVPRIAAVLPTLLNLSLAGLDANDDFRTASTLEFYYVRTCYRYSH